MKTECNTDHG